MRLIDADAFDRRLANAEFSAALNEANDNDRPFEHQAMYYSTQSFRDTMKYQPTIEAITIRQLEEWEKDVTNIILSRSAHLVLHWYKIQNERSKE